MNPNPKYTPSQSFSLDIQNVSTSNDQFDFFN